MRGIDGIIYINLDHRTDRKELMEQEFERLGIPQEKVHRQSGVFDRLNGAKGCMLSHIQALELAEKRGWETTLILEDDALFISDLASMESSLDTFYESVGDEWDVFFLGGTYRKKEQTPWKAFFRVLEGLCGHAYLVHGPYLNKLRACFLCSSQLIQDHLFTGQSLDYALDRVWKILQEQDRWYASQKQFVIQRVLSSDIDIVAAPLNRFLRVIYVDQGNEAKLFGEFERLRLDQRRLHRVESHFEAIEKAIELGRENALIVDDKASFPDDIIALDQQILHFFRWVGRDWGLFLLEGNVSEAKEAKHPSFYQVYQMGQHKVYAVNETFYQTLFHHYSEGGELDSFPIHPESAIFCSKGDK